MWNNRSLLNNGFRFQSELTVWLICLLLFASAMLAGAQRVQGVTGGPIEESIVSWLLLPEAQRAQGTNSFEEHFPADPPNRRMYIQGALKFYLKPPVGGPAAESYLDLAIRLGSNNNVISFAMVTEMLNTQGAEIGVGPVGPVGYPAARPVTVHAAVRMLGVITKRQPGDLAVQLKAARMLEECNARDAALTLLYTAIASVPEPERRCLRLEALACCKTWQSTPAFTAAQQADPLFSADSLLMEKRYLEAAVKYSAVVADHAALLEHRLTAWAGLLDTEPANALKMASMVLAAIEKCDTETRPRLVVWFGLELWRVMIREVPNQFRTAVPANPGVSIQGVKDWQTVFADLMDTLLRLEPGACMRPDALGFPASLRYPAAVFYALKGDMAKSQEIAFRKQEFMVPPPPEGWRIFDGTPTPDTRLPRKGVSPTKEESQNIQQWVADIQRTFANIAKPVITTEPLRFAEAQLLVKGMQSETEETKLGVSLKQLAVIVADSVTRLDPLPKVLRTDLPPPPTREVDLTRFAPIAQAVRDALKIDSVQKNSYTLLKEGLMPAMMTASNPQFLELLYQLSTEVIDCYGNALKPFYAADAAKTLADNLAQRPVYDMSVYVQRLKLKYPKNP